VHSELVIGAITVSSSTDLDAAFDEISRQHPDALIILNDNSLLGLAEAIVARAMAQRVPVFASLPYAFSQAGGLVTYSRDPNESFQATARLLKKILNGARPADLPVEQPTKFLLAINLRTAKALDISIPPALLARADEVFE
jgi:putative tryptophan/tyrosine transport system substrate-binding protein